MTKFHQIPAVNHQKAAQLIYKKYRDYFNSDQLEIDLRNEKIGYKIREHSNNAIPIIIVIGDKEQETKTVAVRYLGSKNQENLDLETFIENVKRKCLPPDLV